MRLSFLTTLVAATAILLAVGCRAAPPSNSEGGIKEFRAPVIVPDSLRTAGPRYRTGPDHIPYLVQLWEGPVPEPSGGATVTFGGVEWPAGSEPQGVVFGAIAREMEMDLGGVREPVDVDGARGWFWRLDESDFLPPANHDLELTEAKELSRAGLLRERLMYIDEIRHIRAYDGAHTRIPFRGHLLSGRAIALQWNREGIHYIVIAKDKPPMSREALFAMADSMAPIGGVKTLGR